MLSLRHSINNISNDNHSGETACADAGLGQAPGASLPHCTEERCPGPPGGSPASPMSAGVKHAQSPTVGRLGVMQLLWSFVAEAGEPWRERTKALASSPDLADGATVTLGTNT